MTTIDTRSWEARARAAERTVDVLKNKVFGLYNGDQSSIQKQLERARVREEENRRRRAVMEARADEMAKYTAGLEKEVAARTRELTIILDNVTFGFLVIDRDLVIQPGFTKSCGALLSKSDLSGANFLDALAVSSERERSHFLLSVDQIFEDLLPEALLLDQMPSRFEVGERVVKLEGRTIRDDAGRVTGLLVTISDNTSLETAQRESRTNGALLSILKNRDAFVDFIADSRNQLELARAAIADAAYVRRVIHTLKGNAASFGLDEVAALIHEIEEQDVVTHEHLASIAAAYEAFLERHTDILGLSFSAANDNSYEVSAHRMAELKTMVRDTKAAEPLRRWTLELELKPIRTLLGPIDNFVQRLADRLNKRVRFDLEGGEVSVHAQILQPVVRNLTHLFRNAVDHGIEAPDARQDKPLEGHVQLKISERDDAWVLEMNDDGRGIDTDKLTARAVASGRVNQSEVASLTEQDRLSLIFLDGLSSADVTTDVSGRGVGMSAVWDAVREAEGQIEVTSELGRGTRFLITVPKPPELVPAGEAPLPFVGRQAAR